MKKNINMKFNPKEEIKNYMEYEYDELENMLENPQDIETGCEFNCDYCIEQETGLIKEAIRRKELQDEHIREFGNK